jgi:hypothetical protein
MSTTETITIEVPSESLREQMGLLAEQRAKIKTILDERNRISDEALVDAKSRLEHVWNATHCVNRGCWEGTMAFYAMLSMAAMFVCGLLMLLFSIEGGDPPLRAFWIVVTVIPWGGLMLLGIYHIPLCSRRGNCGSCRRCPCSK